MKREGDRIGFSDLSKRDRILMVWIIVLSLVVLVLAILHTISVWDDAIKVYIPILSVTMVLQALYQKGKEKSLVLAYSGVAVFLAICSILLIFVV